MSNKDTNDIDEIIDFLGSADTVLTSSYHGMYWSILLGRKVIAFPFSSKFFTFKYHIPLSNPKWRSRSEWWLDRLKPLARVYDYHRHIPYGRMKKTASIDRWEALLPGCKVYKEALADGRRQNVKFHDKVMKFLNA